MAKSGPAYPTTGRFPGNNSIPRKEVYDYLMTKKGMTPQKANAIMSNIEGESGFYSDAIQTGNVENRGLGLFQHTFSTRKEDLVKQVPDWETNWKGQIDFAMSESEMKSFMRKDYDNQEEATEGFMQTFEKPAITSDKYPGKTLTKSGNKYYYKVPKKEGETNKPTDIVINGKRYTRVDIPKEDYTNAVRKKSNGRLTTYSNTNFGSQQNLSQTTRTAPDLTQKDDSVYSEHYGGDARVTNISGKDFVVVDYGNGQVLQYPIEKANSDVASGFAVVEDTAPTADNVTVTDEEYSITDLQESDEFAEFEPTFINSLQNENLTDEEIRNEIQKEYPDQKIDVVRDGQGNLRVINQRTVQNEETETGQTNVTQQPNVIDQTIDPPIERVSPVVEASVVEAPVVEAPVVEVEDVEEEDVEEAPEGVPVPAPPSNENTVPRPTTGDPEVTQELQQQVDASEISELPEAPEGTEEGEVFTVDGKDYELKDGAVVYLGNAQIEEEGEEENVIPSVEEIERRHGPDAKIVNHNGRDKIQYPDENGELKYYDAYDFYSEENLERYALNDSGNLPPPSDLNIGDQTARQDNTTGPNINTVEVTTDPPVEGIDPSFIPNDDTTPLVTTATDNDVDGDGVPNYLDPDSQTVDIVNTDFSNASTKKTPPANNLTKTFGDLGNVIGDSLGLVNSVRDLINGPDDLIRAALGEQAFKESMKEVIPQELPELSNQFKQHLAQVQNLSKQGFSVAEANKAKQDIDAAYKQGIENTVRGTSGDRAKFLAMSGVLDQARSSALLEFAAKDAELNRANQAAYTSALSFGEEYNLNKSTTEASQQLQLDLEKKRGASEFAKEAFKGLNDRIGPAGNQYLNTLQSFVKDNQNPYSLTLETPGTTTNTGGN